MIAQPDRKNGKPLAVLVATDGTPAAMGALRMADALAKQHGGSVEVISVVEPPPVSEYAVGDLLGMSREDLAREMVGDLRQVMEDQLADIGSSTAGWRISVQVGPPAATIVRRAENIGATLILLGIGKHAIVDRMLGTETALKVMGLAHIPVFAIPPETFGRVKVALLAVDFTEFSRDAAETALRILPAGSEVHFAHVLWKPAPDVEWMGGADWYEGYRGRVSTQLRRLAHDLDPTGKFEIHIHELEGGVPGELLRLAYRVRADLIAAGSHGAGFIGRMLMGSVSTRLVRGATCSVLIAPPRAIPAELERAAEAVEATPAIA